VCMHEVELDNRPCVLGESAAYFKQVALKFCVPQEEHCVGFAANDSSFAVSEVDHKEKAHDSRVGFFLKR
jgi:hypothetical protein